MEHATNLPHDRVCCQMYVADSESCVAECVTRVTLSRSNTSVCTNEILHADPTCCSTQTIIRNQKNLNALNPLGDLFPVGVHTHNVFNPNRVPLVHVVGAPAAKVLPNHRLDFQVPYQQYGCADRRDGALVPYPSKRSKLDPIVKLADLIRRW